MQTTKHWGQHLILDIGDCNERISQQESIHAFVVELVDAIDMVAYGDPVIQYFATHSQEAAGYSLVQLIETSAITAHFSDHNKDAYLDVFSCKSFDEERVVQVVNKHFEPQSIYSLSLHREAKRPAQLPFSRIK